MMKIEARVSEVYDPVLAATALATHRAEPASHGARSLTCPTNATGSPLVTGGVATT